MQEIEKYYSILGISKDATEEEIKNAYIKLKRKYDPDNYEKEELKKHAEEKTEEIIKAFDTIMNEKRAKKIENKDEEEKTKNFDKNPFKNVEDLIEENQLERADSILMEVPQQKRSARWYFLRGVILFKKGWLMEASNFFSTAVSMEPDNEEYKKAYEKALWQAEGGFNRNQGPYSRGYPNQQGPIGCSFCDICGAMMCMDMCCDCGSPGGPYRC